MKREFVLLSVLVIGSLSMTGCRPAEESFGEIITDMSEVPGSDKPYQLPDLGEMEAGDTETSGGGHDPHRGHSHH